MTCRVLFLTDSLVLQFRATLVGWESSSADYGVLKVTELKLKQVLHIILYFKSVVMLIKR